MQETYYARRADLRRACLKIHGRVFGCDEEQITTYTLLCLFPTHTYCFLIRPISLESQMGIAQHMV